MPILESLRAAGGQIAGSLRVLIVLSITASSLLADGKVFRPRDYKGSLEESSQEAIIIFNGSSEPGEATEDLILKISVLGEAEEFAWIVPFPNAPETHEEDPKLFEECFRYVDARQRSRYKKKGLGQDSKNESASKAAAEKVRVISQKVVGKFLVTVVKEEEAGTLNEWLKENGYETLEADNSTLEFYRKKGYVFACIKVTDIARGERQDKKRPLTLHPLRFSFKTGGRDGIYFPMRMTGLQTEPFDVNLYVFYGKWLNDDLSQFGFVHRGFQLVHRDWDTSKCKPNAGKSWSAPETDHYLRPLAGTIPTVTKLFQKLHPGKRYYMTNLAAHGLKPADVRQWSDDLWLFPYYTDKAMVPYDARKDGAAHWAWPNLEVSEDGRIPSIAKEVDRRGNVAIYLYAGGLLLALAIAVLVLKQKSRQTF